MSRIIAHLWFEKEARQAVDFYVSIIPNSTVIHATALPAETPSGPAGSVSIIDFTLNGRDFVALEAGPLDPFNHAFSIMVECDDQSEIERIWNAFLANGGQSEQCGWLKDKWGLSWQIVPRILSEMIADPDREKARRATEAMLRMVKIDIATIEKAFSGAP